MSNILDLIARHCPDGVEYQPLKELARRNQGVSITAGRMKTLHRPGAPIRVFAAGSTVADVPEGAVPAHRIIRQPSIIVKGRGHVGFEYHSGPFAHKSELWSYTFSDQVLPRFVLHYLRTQVPFLQATARATSVKLPQLSVGDTDNLRIPVPPLEVQRSIAEILDKMERLEAELEAELEARTRQYEHYRTSLLSEIHDDGVDATLGEALQLKAGKFISAKLISAVRDEAHPYPCYGGGGLRGFVSEPSHEGPHSLIGRQGALCGNVKHVDEPFYATEHAVVVTPREIVHRRWAHHVLVEMNLNQYASKSAQPGLSVKLISGLPLQIPPMPEQRRIADILDRFDVLVNDLSHGLPAEIAARRKQYAYYRDLLLTFPEKKAA